MAALEANLQEDGLHLVWVDEQPQLAITHHYRDLWMRKYSVILTELLHPVEVIFTFGVQGTFLDFCRLTSIMDSVVESIKIVPKARPSSKTPDHNHLRRSSTRRFLARLFGPPDIEKLKETFNIPGLIKALRHDDPTVRADAEKALIEIEKIGRTDVIYRLIESGLKYADTREVAIRILKEAPVQTATDILIHLLEAAVFDAKQGLYRDDPLEWLCDIFIGIGTVSVEPLLRLYSDPDYEYIVRYIISEIGVPALNALAILAEREAPIHEQAEKLLKKLSRNDTNKEN